MSGLLWRVRATRSVEPYVRYRGVVAAGSAKINGSNGSKPPVRFFRKRSLKPALLTTLSALCHRLLRPRSGLWRSYLECRQRVVKSHWAVLAHDGSNALITGRSWYSKFPNGFLKRLLEAGGCPRDAVKDLGSMKLLQALLNVVERLDADEEARDAFASTAEPDGWNLNNERMAPLFVAHDLRIADAHETFGEDLQRLQDLGFDTASLRQGYALALDFVMDRVIGAFADINRPLTRIVAR